MDSVSIARAARASDSFRRVLITAQHVQVVVMTLQPGEDIGAEVHAHNDQVLLFLDGTVRAEIGIETAQLAAGDLLVVPAGTEHNVTNVGEGEVRLCTFYAPPEHPDGTVHATKAEADAAEDHGAG